MPDLSLLLEAFAFGIAVAFILIGLVGIVVPILPGILLIWLTVLAYAIVEGFEAIGWVSFIFITFLVKSKLRCPGFFFEVFERVLIRSII